MFNAFFTYYQNFSGQWKTKTQTISVYKLLQIIQAALIYVKIQRSYNLI